MSVLEIKKAGEEVLKNIAAPVNKIDRSIKKLLDDMAETMYQAEGVGLAAPQVGVSLQVIVVDVGDGLIELINPKIIETEGSEIGVEGCLSVPYLSGKVERYAKVTVEALNRSGKKICLNNAQELLARALQHEIDHLHGVLFIEKAKSLHMLDGEQ